MTNNIHNKYILMFVALIPGRGYRGKYSLNCTYCWTV